MTTWFVPTKSEDQISVECLREDAMAENEKLRALLAEVRRVVGAEPVGELSPDYRQGWGAGYIEGATEYKRERDEARAEVAAAYQRGAEAMREACLKEVLNEKDNLDRGEIEDAIRALPISEDKS